MYMLHFLTLLFTGLLAGFEIAIHYGLGAPPQSLSEPAQIVLRQAMVRRLRILAPLLFLPALALSVGLTIQEWHRGAARLHLLALALLAVWLIIRVLRTVPVNSATLEWEPEMPPPGWRELIERTERFHVIAAWAAVFAFICFLVPALSHP